MSSSRGFLSLTFLSLLLAALAIQATRAYYPEHVDQLKRTGSCAGCDLSDADLQGVSAAKGDLTGSNLTGANLYRANLQEADLSGAALTGADLSGANLTLAKGLNLDGAKTDERTTCQNGSKGPCK